MSVLQHPGVAAFDGPAPLAQARAARLAAPVDAGLGAELPTQIPMALGVVAFVGEHGPDAGHDGEGSEEQPLEDERVVDVGRCGGARDRHAVPGDRDVILGAPFGPVRQIGPGESAAALGADRAAVQDQVRVAPQHADQQGMDLRQHAEPRPTG
jgi:hypothetical protein